MNGDSEISGRHGSGIVRLQRNRKYAIGVGAVGQPRDGDPRACYVIYDFDLAIVEYRRVEYDIAEARRKIHQAGLPPYCGDRLLEGV
jgi:diadenosine tetraphosphatase ApaH/serine/threonine PP2A family protein phosphatase